MTRGNLILRRTHLYLGMFLFPWIVVYALSSLVFNHHALFRGWFGHEGPQWTVVSEEEYSIQLPAGNEGLREIGEQILKDHGLQGAFGVSRNGQRLNIRLFEFWHPKRLTYFGRQHRLKVEERRFAWTEFMGRLHIKAGYQQAGFWNDAWAVVVDLVCLSIIAWVVTGLYLWWKLPATRRPGWAAIAAGWIAIVVLVVAL